VHAPTTIDHLSEFAATRLFVARAEAARPDFRITPRSHRQLALRSSTGDRKAISPSLFVIDNDMRTTTFNS